MSMPHCRLARPLPFFSRCDRYASPQGYVVRRCALYASLCALEEFGHTDYADQRFSRAYIHVLRLSDIFQDTAEPPDKYVPIRQPTERISAISRSTADDRHFVEYTLVADTLMLPGSPA